MDARPLSHDAPQPGGARGRRRRAAGGGGAQRGWGGAPGAAAGRARALAGATRGSTRIVAWDDSAPACFLDKSNCYDFYFNEFHE